MTEETQTAAPTPTRRAAARVPGEAPEAAQTDTPEVAADPAQGEEPTTATTRFSIPDFRHKSAIAAKAWFEANPNAPKRGVLTHDGWYLPEGAHAIAGGQSVR